MNNKLISVIIPVFNVQNYLEQCLNSIIKQTYQNLEVILVDDGSTDESGKICDHFSEKDPRFITIHKPNGGVSSARNEALKHIHGWSVTFIDSDDTIDYNYIECMIKGMIEYNVNFVRAHFKRNGIIQHNFIPNDDDRTILIDISSCETLELLAYAGGIMIKASCLKNTLFNENIAYGEDQLFLATCFFKSKSSKILLLGQPYYNYTYRENSASNSSFNEKWLSLKKSADEIVAALSPFPEAKRLSLYTKRNFYLMLYKKLILLKDSKYKTIIRSLKKDILSLKRQGIKSSNRNIEIVEMSYIYGFNKLIETIRKFKHFFCKKRINA